MRVIYKIARLELANLFFSLVAWFVLVFWVFIMGLNFTGKMEEMARMQEFGSSFYAITEKLFYGIGGLCVFLKTVLYFVMPVLTMGLISQEYNFGSIKLLFSSPITSRQIVFGKYLGIMAYGLLIMAFMFLYVLVSWCTVENFEWQVVLNGMLGLYLLFGLYAAIGLFMSALTNYQILSAICMLVMLTVLNWIVGIGQEYAFIRDITYWMSFESRVGNFIKGMLCSEDVLYFIILSLMFLCFSVLKMQLQRERCSLTSKVLRYVGVFVVAMLLGYITSRPALKLYYDATYTKVNTLSQETQDIVAQLDGGLKITTYSNLLGKDYRIPPKLVRRDMDRYENYLRFKPEMELEYVLYYNADTANSTFKHYYGGKSVKEAAELAAKLANDKLGHYLSPEEIDEKFDLKPFGYRFLMVVERENGQKLYLHTFNDSRRLPSEKEIAAALRRFIKKAPRIGYLTDHSDRTITTQNNRDYYSLADLSYRFSLINQGFDMVNVSLQRDGRSILDSLDVLMIMDPVEKFTDEELEILDEYIASGKNLLIAAKPRSAGNLKPLTDQLGIAFEPGILVQHPGKDQVANIVSCEPAGDVQNFSPHFSSASYNNNYVMPGASAIDIVDPGDFKITPLLVTVDKKAWNEMQTIDFVNEVATLDEKFGESTGEKITFMSLERKCNNRDQRILVMGDADCISMGELGTTRRGISSANALLINATFGWLVYDELPLKLKRPQSIDNRLDMSWSQASTVSIILKWIMPIVILLLGTFILINRKRK